MDRANLHNHASCVLPPEGGGILRRKNQSVWPSLLTVRPHEEGLPLRR